jgi:hypothetical protein
VRSWFLADCGGVLQEDAGCRIAQSRDHSEMNIVQGRNRPVYALEAHEGATFTMAVVRANGEVHCGSERWMVGLRT